MPVIITGDVAAEMLKASGTGTKGDEPKSMAGLDGFNGDPSKDWSKIEKRTDAEVWKSGMWDHPPVPTRNGKTILQQLGGVEKLHRWVDGFYDKMVADKDVGPFMLKAKSTAPEGIYLKLLKERTTEYLECVWGGDQWEGADMYVSHCTMGIRPDIFDRSMQLGKEQLKSMSVSKDVIDQVMAEMLIMKEPMSDPQGKFREWYRKRQENIEAKLNAEGTVDLTGMGFSTSKYQAERVLAYIKTRDERSKRLAEAKKKRLEDENREKKENTQDKTGKDASNTQAKAKASPANGKAKSTVTAGQTSTKLEAKKGVKRHGQSNGMEIGPGKVGAAAAVGTEIPEKIIVPELPSDVDCGVFMPESNPTPIFHAHFCMHEYAIQS